MTVAERRKSYRRVQYVYARDLMVGNVVCSDDGPWRIVDIVVTDDRVWIHSHTGWQFCCRASTRFKRKVTGAGR